MRIDKLINRLHPHGFVIGERHKKSGQSACTLSFDSHTPAPTKTIMASNEALKSLQLHDKDTGSADVQIAILTERINQLTDHFKKHTKDHSSRRGLLMMVARRRSLLDYLKKTSNDRYKAVIEKLNLRK